MEVPSELEISNPKGYDILVPPRVSMSNEIDTAVAGLLPVACQRNFTTVEKVADVYLRTLPPVPMVYDEPVTAFPVSSATKSAYPI